MNKSIMAIFCIFFTGLQAMENRDTGPENLASPVTEAWWIFNKRVAAPLDRIMGDDYAQMPDASADIQNYAREAQDRLGIPREYQRFPVKKWANPRAAAGVSATSMLADEGKLEYGHDGQKNFIFLHEAAHVYHSDAAKRLVGANLILGALGYGVYYKSLKDIDKVRREGIRLGKATEIFGKFTGRLFLSLCVVWPTIGFLWGRAVETRADRTALAHIECDPCLEEIAEARTTYSDGTPVAPGREVTVDGYLSRDGVQKYREARYEQYLKEQRRSFSFCHEHTGGSRHAYEVTAFAEEFDSRLMAERLEAFSRRKEREKIEEKQRLQKFYKEHSWYENLD